MSRLHAVRGRCVAQTITGNDRVFMLRKPRKEWIDTPNGVRWFVRIPIHGKPRKSRLKFFKTEEAADIAIAAYMKRGM